MSPRGRTKYRRVDSAAAAYRSSVSSHADRFLLKGALLFLLWSESLYRPTHDVICWGSTGRSAPDERKSVRIFTTNKAQLAAKHWARRSSRTRADLGKIPKHKRGLRQHVLLGLRRGRELARAYAR